MQPNWTVLYSIKSPENDKWTGKGFEFFDKEEDAEACYQRQILAGNQPTKRLYYDNVDWENLALHHRVKFLTEDQSGIVAAHVKSLSSSELVESVNRYQNMPTCLSLVLNEIKRRLGEDNVNVH